MFYIQLLSIVVRLLTGNITIEYCKIWWSELFSILPWFLLIRIREKFEKTNRGL